MSDPEVIRQGKSSSAAADKQAWEMPPRGDRYLQIRISRNTTIAIVVSLLLHLLVLLTLAPRLQELGEPSKDANKTLVVELAAPPNSKAKEPEPLPAAPAPAEPTPPTPKAKPRPAKPVSKPKPVETKPQPKTPEVMAVDKPKLDNLRIPITPRAPQTESAPTDMMAYVQQQRERRQAAQGMTERDSTEINTRDNPMSEEAKRDEIIKRNLQQEGGNGIFQIREKRARTAQFSFKGWKNDYTQARMQLIDVEAGPDGDIDRAIVRQMIAIIRKDYKGDFNWDSQRLGRVVVLSARPEDNAGLEDFLIKEFFGNQGISARDMR